MNLRTNFNSQENNSKNKTIIKKTRIPNQTRTTILVKGYTKKNSFGKTERHESETDAWNSVAKRAHKLQNTATHAHTHTRVQRKKSLRSQTNAKQSFANETKKKKHT